MEVESVQNFSNKFLDASYIGNNDQLLLLINRVSKEDYFNYYKRTVLFFGKFINTMDIFVPGVCFVVRFI